MLPELSVLLCDALLLHRSRWEMQLLRMTSISSPGFVLNRSGELVFSSLAPMCLGCVGVLEAAGGAGVSDQGDDLVMLVRRFAGLHGSVLRSWVQPF